MNSVGKVKRKLQCLVWGFFWRGQGAVGRISWLCPGRHSHRAETLGQSPAHPVKANNPLLGRPHPYTPQNTKQVSCEGNFGWKGRGIQGAKLYLRRRSRWFWERGKESGYPSLARQSAPKPVRTPLTLSPDVVGLSYLQIGRESPLESG